MTQPETLMEHARNTACEDPDCEIHCPWVIEDEPARDAACAWFAAGMHRERALTANAIDELYEDRKESLAHILTTPDNMEEALA